MTTASRCALYARVSSDGQTCENQLLELRQYANARGWTVSGEYLDQGVSGAKDSRPALNQLLADARRRRLDTIIVWALDRWGRSLPHLVATLHDLQQIGVGFVSLRDGLDLSTAAGRLQMHVLAALAAFERDRLRERVVAGLQRARAEGTRLGRQPYALDDGQLADVEGLLVRAAAKVLGVSYSVVSRRRALLRKPLQADRTFASETGPICPGPSETLPVAEPNVSATPDPSHARRLVHSE